MPKADVGDVIRVQIPQLHVLLSDFELFTFVHWHMESEVKKPIIFETQ